MHHSHHPRITSITSVFTVAIALTLALAIEGTARMVVPLGDEFDVNTYTTGSQSDVSVSMDRDGDFVVVWKSQRIEAGQVSQDGSASGVFGRLFDSTGTAVTAEFQVNSYTPSAQSRGRVYMPPDGGSFVVLYTGYNEQDGDRSGVFARTYVGSTPQDADEIQINTYTTGFQVGGTVVFVDDNNGVGSNFASSQQALPSSLHDNVIVYEGPLAEDPDGGIGARRTDASGPGGPNEAEFLINGYTTGQQGDADACGASDGTFVVVWNSDDQDGDGLGMFAHRFDSSASPIGTEFQVNSYTTGSQAFGRVCCAADGRFTVGWTDLDGLDGKFSGVFARQFDSGGQPVADQFQVNTYTPGSQTISSLACTPQGDAIPVWQTLGGPLRGRAFGASGAALTDEFEISQFDVGVPARGGIGIAEDGTFVVAWHKRSADGDHDGVQARRFALLDATTTTSTTMTTTTSTTITTVPVSTTSSSTTMATPTTTSTTSTTLAPAGECGDPVTDVVAASGPAAVITASDALVVLRAALRLEVCAACVCDVDGSGSITTTDALTVLLLAVQAPVDLSCPAC